MRMDGVVAEWNAVAEPTVGWSYADAFGRRMSELIIPVLCSRTNGISN